jgi:hypothetical protein
MGTSARKVLAANAATTIEIAQIRGVSMAVMVPCMAARVNCPVAAIGKLPVNPRGSQRVVLLK